MVGDTRAQWQKGQTGKKCSPVSEDLGLQGKTPQLLPSVEKNQYSSWPQKKPSTTDSETDIYTVKFQLNKLVKNYHIFIILTWQKKNSTSRIY